MNFVSVCRAAKGGGYRKLGILGLLFLMNGALSGCGLGYLALIGEHAVATSIATGDVDPKSPAFLEACKKDAGIHIYEVARDVHGYVSMPRVFVKEDGSQVVSGAYGFYSTPRCGLCESLLKSRWDFQEKKIAKESDGRTVHVDARSGTKANSRRVLIRSKTYVSKSVRYRTRKELADGPGWTRYVRVKRPSQLCTKFDSLGGKSAAEGYEDVCVAAISINQPTARYETQSYFQPIYARVADRDGKIRDAYISRRWEVIRDRKNGRVMAQAVHYSFKETVDVVSFMADQYTSVFGDCGTSGLQIEEVLIPARPKT